jgi:hypothetical protein
MAHERSLPTHDDDNGRGIPTESDRVDANAAEKERDSPSYKSLVGARAFEDPRGTPWLRCLTCGGETASEDRECPHCLVDFTQPIVGRTDREHYTAVMRAVFGLVASTERTAWAETPGRVGTVLAWERVIAKVLSVSAPSVAVQAALRAHAVVVGEHWIGAVFDDRGAMVASLAIRTWPRRGGDVMHHLLEHIRDEMIEPTDDLFDGRKSER